MDNKITLRMLEGFQAVMQAKTITAAAEILYVSQPVVSRLIRDLERNIGFSLFIREGGRLKPTHEATILYDEVRKSLVGIDLILQRVKTLRDGHQSRLKIAAAPALMLTFLPQTTARFSKQYPGAQISLQMHGSDIGLDLVQNGLCDIALVMLPTHELGKHGELLASGCVVCALPAGHRLANNTVVTPEDLRDEAFISHPHALDTRLKIDQIFASRGIDRKMKLESQISNTLLEFVKAGSGVALIDPVTASLDISDAVIYIRFDPIVVNSYSAVVSLERTQSVLQDKYIEYVKNDLRDSINPEYRLVT